MTTGKYQNGGKATSENVRILLVEDNPGDQRLIKEYLKDTPIMNLELRVADTLEEAKKILEEGQTDITLLDLGLPDSSGLATVNETIAVAPLVPVIVLTGLSDNTRAMEAINSGAQDYLVKDFVNTEKLVRSIRYSLHRKQAQVRIEESEMKFRSLWDNSLSGLAYLELVIDDKGQPIDSVITEVNPRFEELTGLTRKGAIGKSFNEVKSGLFSTHFDPTPMLWKVALTQKHISFEFENPISKRRFSVSVYSPSYKTFVCALQDISHLKKAEEALRESDQRSRQAAETSQLYLDIMSHDVRNHLQAVIMASDVLEDMKIEGEHETVLAIIVESVQKSQNLIQKIITTRNLMLVPLSEISLKQAIENSLATLKESYHEVPLEVKYQVDDPQVLADEFIGQLLVNILENAVEHVDNKAKKVWIDVQEKEEGYQISIMDNGPGITDEKKEELFDPKRRFGGVGIHQSIRILKKYRGHMSVHDRVRSDSSQGAEFRLWIPKI